MKHVWNEFWRLQLGKLKYIRIYTSKYVYNIDILRCVSSFYLYFVGITVKNYENRDKISSPLYYIFPFFHYASNRQVRDITNDLIGKWLFSLLEMEYNFVFSICIQFHPYITGEINCLSCFVLMMFNKFYTINIKAQ